MSKIHFINRIDYTNAGDWMCSPLISYYDYFSRYSYIRHDIGHVIFQIIQKDDLVIIGGGGMINVSTQFNRTINLLLECCDNVIGWGIGFNECDYKYKYYEKAELEKIHFEKFMLLSIRDYNHPSGFEWVPCPSVNSVLRYRDLNIANERNIGVIEHKAASINVNGIEKISNALEFDRIVRFICESNIIVTNSYHAAYWAQVLKKKVVVINKFSSKFSYFKEPVIYLEKDGMISADDITECINKSQSKKHNETNTYDYVARNSSFLEKIKTIINNLNMDKNDSDFYTMSLLQSWNYQTKFVQREEYDNLHNAVFKRIDEVYYQLVDYVNKKTE